MAYKTRNMTEAAYHYCSGYKLELEEIPSEPGNYLLVFPDVCQEKARDFWNKSTQVDALSYAEALKSIRGQIEVEREKK